MNIWVKGSIIAFIILILGFALALIQDFSFFPADKVENERSDRAVVEGGEDLPPMLLGEWRLDYTVSMTASRGTPLGEPDVEESRNTIITFGPRSWHMRSDRAEETFEVSILENPESGVWILGSFVQQKLLVLEVKLLDGSLVVDSPLNNKLKHFVWVR